MPHEGAWNGLEIAIVGMSCRFPGASDVEAFWRNLRDGVESITFFDEAELEPSAIEDPALRRDPAYVRAAPILEGVDQFDAAFFGLTPREAELTDPQHRLFLECAWEALESAGYDPERYKGRIGVYGGARTNTYLFNLFSNPAAVGGLGAFELGLGNDLGFLSTRVAHRLNLRGPAYSIHTACSTALVAVHLAGQALLAGECQMALAGGVAVNVPQRSGYLHQFGSITSPDGHCRAFDAKAQGTVFGSGAGVVALKRLEDALADGDVIHAIIKGSAINNDGAQKASFTAPSIQGQARVIRDALASAEVEARSITCVEAHGTGTALGDPIEVRALTRAFRASTEDRGFCALGSVKTNLGHLDAAAGVASLIKAVLALKHRQIPPSLHFESPNPQMGIEESPFFVNAELREWSPGPYPRRAGVSAFGVGGTNAHVILEEAPEAAPRVADTQPWQLLALSARSEAALDAMSSALADALEATPQLSLGDVAYTLQVGRQVFAHRRAVVSRDRAHAARLLRGEEPDRVLTACEEARRRPVAFLFPGVGTQYEAMGAGLYQTEPVFRSEIDRLAEVFRPLISTDLRLSLTASPSHQKPGRTTSSVSLPAIFSAEVALARLWMSWGVEPEIMLGHSLGEYAAAHLAEVMSLEDAAALVALRGEIFDGLPAGAMLSVALPERELTPLLDGSLCIAAVNAPSQCVVSGSTAGVAAIAALLAERGVDCRRLHVEHATHSPMLDPALGRFRDRAAAVRFGAPRRPYVSSLTGKLAGNEVARPEFWVNQLRQTVRFADAMREVLADPARVLLEVGPGQALTTLARLQGEPPGALTSVPSMRLPDASRPDDASLRPALGRLWAAGVEIRWEGVHDGARRRVPLPTYPFEHDTYWVPPGDSAGARSLPEGKSPDVASWFHVPSWRRTAPPALAPEALATPRGWVVLTDDSPLSEALVGRLRQAGQDVVTVAPGAVFSAEGGRRFAVRPAQPDDYLRLLEALRQRPDAPRPEVFVHLWSTTPGGDMASSPARFRALQERGYESVLALGQALARGGGSEPLRLEVISDRIHDVDGEGALLPEKAPMLGVCKVLPQEQQHVAARCIDIALPLDDAAAERLAEQLVAEIAARSPDMVVAYRGRRRLVQAFAPLRLEDLAPSRPLRERGVYLITGGLGGVGLLLAERLAETRRARLVLVGRTPSPPRDSWDAWLAERGEDDRTSRVIRRLLAMEAKGAEVLALGADVADHTQLEGVIAHAERRFGALHGVLHAAGVTRGNSLYKALTEIEPEMSGAQFHPKVHGTYALERALGGRALDFVLLFSSNAAVLGGLGYVTYAAANLFMDAFAQSRARGGACWLSAGWDPWPEETKQYAGFRTSMDQYAMTREECVEAFERLVTRGLDGHVVVATGALEQRLALWIHRNAAPARRGGAATRDRRRRGSHAAPEGEVEQAIASIWQEILGGDAIGRHDDFFDLGGHSLLATQVAGRIRTALGVELPLAKLFEAPTVAGLARAVATERTQADEAERRELLKHIQGLSDEEIEAELARRGVPQ
ncbi:MAG: SDR family NAD(P)-dependent oxidoreductase [Polyangiaceae bacterium]|jgi:acyl transferase domain-containing protein/acyl carrier protein|nr:SDR family NAD(P)-dependent oxidoreductase [Polyangiaceae bacterium]